MGTNFFSHVSGKSLREADFRIIIRIYAVLVWIQFGKSMGGCGRMKRRTANLRELTRIAFFLHRRALLRLIAYAGIARRLEKCYWKNRRAGFSFCLSLSFFVILGCGRVTSARSPTQWKYPVYYANTLLQKKSISKITVLLIP